MIKVVESLIIMSVTINVLMTVDALSWVEQYFAYTDGSFNPCHVTDPDAVCLRFSDIPCSQVSWRFRQWKKRCRLTQWTDLLL